MPGHRVIAGGDGNAGEALEPGCGLGDAQAGAGDEDRLDARRGGEAPDRRFDRGDGNARGVAVVAAVERGDGGDFDAARAEIGGKRSVDLGRVGGEEPDRLAPNARKAASAAVTGVVQATSGRALRISANTASSPSVIVADVQPKATTSSGMPGRMSATLGAILGPMARKVSGRMSASL